MARVLTNNISLAYTIESALNTPGTSWKLLEPNSIKKFGSDIKTTSRTPISKSRQRRKGTITDLDSAVEFDADLTVDAFIDFAEAFVFADFVGPVNFTPSAVVSTSSGSGCTLNVATAGSNPYTVDGTPTAAAGGSNYAIGDLLEINGTGTKAVVRVATLSGSAVATVVVVSVGSYTVDPAGATVATTNISAGYTVPSGGTAVLTNALLYARGFTNTENNGLKLANAASLTTKVRVSGLVAETPPANALLEICGIRGASGDLAINSDGDLTSSALNFTTLGLTVGQTIWIGGDATANKFATAANRGYARIEAIAAGKLTLNKRGQAFSTDSGSGKLIDIYFGKFLRNVDVDHGDYLERSFHFELAYPNLDNPSGDMYEYAEGNYANQLSFDLPLANKAAVTFGFIGTDTEPPSDSRLSGASSAVDPLRKTAFNTSSDIARLRITEVDETGLTTDFKSLKITFNNNVTPEKVIGTLGAKYMNTGNFMVDIEADLLFTNADVASAVRNNTTVTMDFAIRNEDGAIHVDVPSMTLGGGSKDFPVNETVMIKTTSESFEDATLGTSIGISLFPYVPAS